MELDDSLVAVERGRCEFDLFGWEPALREVGTEGQAAVPVVTTDGLFGDFVGEPFGCFPVRASSVSVPSIGKPVEGSVESSSRSRHS